MKKVFRTMFLSASALAFTAAPGTVTQILAQDAGTTPVATPAAAQQCNTVERDKLYNETFLTNYKGTAEQKKTAYNAAKEYVQKYNAPNCTDNADVIKYFLGDASDPKKLGWIAKEEARTAGVAKEAKQKRFNDAVAAGNAAEVFAAGKILLADYPTDDATNTSIMMYMADNGYIQANKKVDTFNSETVATAKAAIERINAGKLPENNNWSPYKSKDDALAWLNYNIGYIDQYRLQNKKDAAPYFYQATKFTSQDISPLHIPYLSIGDWYLDQYTKAAEEYNAKKDDATVSEDEKNRLAGTWKAYADRAMEAYGLAYAKAKANAKLKPEVSKGINDTLKEIYKVRHSGEVTGLDAYVASLSSKPLTDPTTPVTPIVEATPAAAGATTTNGATSTATPTTASGTTVKPVTTSTTSAAATKPTPETKPTPKKNN